MPAAPGDQQAPRPQEVFISYSRKDKDFVRHLDESLKSRGREAWVDWEDIRPTEEWMQAIHAAIEGTDTFVFVLTPDSVASVVCGREIAHAAAHNKRMVPIVARDVNPDTVPEALAKLNWIFFPEGDDFEKATNTLISALDTDLEWIHAHTRLLTRAIEWENKGKNNSFVLRGEDLRAAEQWLAQAGTEKERQPTALQTEYIIASRKAAARRQRITLGTVTFGAVVAIVLAILALIQRGEARKQEGVAKENAAEAIRQKEAALETLSQSDFAQGTRLVADQRAAQALAYFARAVRSNGNPAAATRIASLLTERVWPLPLSPQHKDAVRWFASPDDTRAVVILADGTAEIRENATSKALSGPIRLEAGVDVAAFSPDGTRVVLAGDDQKDGPHESANSAVQLWDAVHNVAINDPVKFKASYVNEEMFAFSEDSRYLAITGITGEPGTLVWDAKTGRDLSHVPSSYGRVQFSLDGEHYLTDSSKIFETRTGKQIGGAQFSTEHVGSLSPDGLRIAVALDAPDGKGKVSILDAPTGQPVMPSLPVMEHSSRVEKLQFSPDGQWLLAIGRFEARVWNARTGQPVTGLLKHPGNQPLSAASFSPDGYRIATVAEDGSVRVWNAGTGDLQMEAIEGGDVASAHFSHDGRYLIIRDSRGTSQRTWDLLGAAARPLSLPGKMIAHHDFMAASVTAGQLRVFDIRSAGILIEAKVGEGRDAPKDVSFSANGARLMVRSGIGVRLWDIPSHRELSSVVDANVAELSRDGSKLLTTTKTAARISDVENGRLLREFKLPDTAHEISSAHLLSDGKLVAISSFGAENVGHVQLWNIETGAPASPPSESISSSPDGAWVVTVNCIDSGEPHVWEVAVGKPGGKPVGNAVQFSCPSEDHIRDPEFNSDGSRFIVSTDFGKVLLFETATGRQVGILREIGGEGQVRFSSDGKLFATSGDAARVWSAVTGAPLINAVRPPENMMFTTVEFSSGGRRLLAAGRGLGEATLHCKALLDTATGYPLADVTSNSFEGVSGYFSPDDLLVVEETNPVRIWNIPPTGKGPAWLADIAEAVAGCALTPAGTIEVLPDRIERLVAARQVVAKLPPDDRWAQIANWFLVAPAERMISPYSKVKVSSYVQRRIKGNTKLQEAVLASPADALARARFGVKLLTDSSDPKASVQADAETLFATLLTPGSADVWQARAKVLTALKRPGEADAVIKAGELSKLPPGTKP
jgi:WD40 repeat protein